MGVVDYYGKKESVFWMYMQLHPKHTSDVIFVKIDRVYLEVYISFFSLLANLCVAAHELVYATSCINKLALTSIERVRCA